MKLTERDYIILKEVYRWRFCMGRHIRKLAKFSGERACDRRLRILVDAGYLKREKLFYGVPYIYTLTHRGRMLLGVSKRADKIKIETLTHDTLVLDTAVYLITRYDLLLDAIKTEKELHMADGFGTRKHRPDFVFIKSDKTACVEVEISHKSKERFLTNLKANYINYDFQIWVLPAREERNKKLLLDGGYTDIYILESEMILSQNERR